MLRLFVGALAGALLGEIPTFVGAEDIVQEGIRVKFEMASAEGDGRGDGVFRQDDLVMVRFEISDTTSGSALPNANPAAWLDRRYPGESANVESCRKKVEAFVGGSILARPEIDLNVYYVLALNDDATISVVDPLFGFGGTRLLSMVLLPAPGDDWALSADGRRLFVSIPATGQVVSVDTATWKIVERVDVGPRPSRLALQADEEYLWLGQASGAAGGKSSIAVVDVRRALVAAEISTGPGPHEMVFDDELRYAFVINSGGSTVSIIDIRSFEKINDLNLGSEPVSVAWSSVSKLAYVTTRAGQIFAIDGEKARIRSRIEAEPGLGAVRFPENRRYGFVLNPVHNTVHILDVASNQIIQTADVLRQPDQVTFSRDLAYIRHAESELILMIPLDEVGEVGRKVPAIDFPGGQNPFGRGSMPSLADGIVQAPESTAVLVANPADKSIYYYKEGMAAPMGSFRNYGRQPRAVLVVDRSLREWSPGVYETTVRLGQPGLYDVAFFLDAPKRVHCFEVLVEASLSGGQSPRPSFFIKPRFERNGPALGLNQLRFELFDRQTGGLKKGVSDLNILVFLTPGTWQQRIPAREIEAGLYEISFDASRPGIYYAFLASPSLGLSYRDSPHFNFEIQP